MTEKILSLIFLLFFPFLFMGFINRVKSIWAGRKGPSLIQPFFDFIKLLKKGEVISSSTHFIFKMSGSVYLVSVFFAGLLIPVLFHSSLLQMEGDFILFIYLLSFGRLFLLLASLSTGSSFEGMGVSREITFSVFLEPAFFIFIASLSAFKGFLSFQQIFQTMDQSQGISILILALSSMILFFMILVEGSRVPIDDPNTHLELTMIHEVIVLDHSGPDLAFIQYANALKMSLFSFLIANLFLPSSLSPIVFIVLFICIHIVIALIIGSIESLLARLRMTHLPQFIFLTVSISLILLSSILLFVFGGM